MGADACVCLCMCTTHNSSTCSQVQLQHPSPAQPPPPAPPTFAFQSVCARVVVRQPTVYSVLGFTRFAWVPLRKLFLKRRGRERKWRMRPVPSVRRRLALAPQLYRRILAAG
mmetsp:Transcript_5504/g.9823  ORF Transcript_5504/g.9823 Transcript_5504/m.9823 type:complete len:112 (-) Transcript_5504:170-505(-)